MNQSSCKRLKKLQRRFIPYIVNNDIYHGKNILLRMVEPERVVSFRVCWVDDKYDSSKSRL